MPISKNILNELNRNPIAVTTAVIGILIGGGALLLAWLQYAGPPETLLNSEPQINNFTSSLILTNLTIVIAFFLSITSSTASLIRLLSLKYVFLSLVISIIIAVLTGFCSLLIIELVPPISITDGGFEAIKGIVTHGTTLIYLAIYGAPLISFIIEKSDTKSEGSFWFIIIVLLIWHVLVSSGITNLATAFLSISNLPTIN